MGTGFRFPRCDQTRSARLNSLAGSEGPPPLLPSRSRHPTFLLRTHLERARASRSGPFFCSLRLCVNSNNTRRKNSACADHADEQADGHGRRAGGWPGLAGPCRFARHRVRTTGEGRGALTGSALRCAGGGGAGSLPCRLPSGHTPIFIPASLRRVGRVKRGGKAKALNRPGTRHERAYNLNGYKCQEGKPSRSRQRARIMSLVSRLPSWVQPGGRHR